VISEFRHPSFILPLSFLAQGDLQVLFPEVHFTAELFLARGDLQVLLPEVHFTAELFSSR